MIAIVPIVLVAAVGLAAAILELRGRQPAPHALPRGYRAGLAFLLGLIALVVLSPQLALVFDRPLPVEPPVNPLAGEGCSDDGSDDTLILVIAVAIYLGARSSLGLLGALVRAIAQPPARVVTGKPAMTVAAVFLGVIFPIVSIRVLIPGPSPDDFTTYGALTPDAGAPDWRAALVVDGLRTGRWRYVERLDGGVNEITSGGPQGHGSWAPSRRLSDGIHGWVGGEPIFVYPDADRRRFVGGPVAHRSRSDVPAERRPHFQTWPAAAARAEGGGWVLIERRADGSLFALKTTESGNPTAVSHRDVWLLVRPSEIPHGIAFVLFLLGLAAARASQRRGNTPGFALLAAWLWLEAGALDLFAYAPVLGL